MRTTFSIIKASKKRVNPSEKQQSVKQIEPKKQLELRVNIQLIQQLDKRTIYTIKKCHSSR